MRSSCIVGLLDRPLCLALIAGICTSDWALAPSLGIILELLWLDVLELGSVVPPFGSLSFLLLFPLAVHFGLNQPGELLLPLILVMLAAYLGAFLERSLRIHENRLVDRVEAWCAGDGFTLAPAGAVLRVALLRAFLQFLLYALCYALLFCLLAVLTARQALPQLLVLNWPMLYAAALMGAVLSLRTHRAYMVLVGSLGTLALLIWVEEKGLF